MSSDHTPLIYVDCDIPDGVTLTAWRRDRLAAERRTRQEARTTLLRRLRPRLGTRPLLWPRFA